MAHDPTFDDVTLRSGTDSIREVDAKKGLTFYVGGQTIAGYVLRIRDDGAVVEVRNQTNSCIAIRMDRVDAIAAS